MLSTFTLSNGLKVATYKLAETRSVHLRLILKGGTANENKSEDGLAHLLEHLILEETKTYKTKTELASFIEDRAGNFIGQTWEFWTKFVITLPFTELENGIKIAKEVFFDPVLSGKYFEKERGVVIQELTERTDKEAYKFWKFWKTHRYIKESHLTWTKEEEIENLKRIKNEDILAFWNRMYTINNCYLLVVGNFDEMTLKKTVEKIFSDLTSSGKENAPATFSNSDLTDAGLHISHREDLKTNKAEIYWGSIGHGEEPNKYTTQGLLTRILGNSRTSRLHQKLRVNSGLVYDVGVGRELEVGGGEVGVYTDVDSKNLVQVLTIVAEEIKEIVENGITDLELSRILNYLKNRALMDFDHPSEIADWVEGDLLWRDKIELPEDYIKRIEKITKDDVSKFAHENWDFSKALFTVQGPVEESIKAKLQPLVDQLSSIK